MPLFFFFSSRRRHTRSLRDWSSDVCSSDLLPADESLQELVVETEVLLDREVDHLGRPRGGAVGMRWRGDQPVCARPDRKSTRLNSSHVEISYAVFCLKKKKTTMREGYCQLQ